jgi:WD40 repeat protein
MRFKIFIIVILSNVVYFNFYAMESNEIKQKESNKNESKHRTSGIAPLRQLVLKFLGNTLAQRVTSENMDDICNEAKNIESYGIRDEDKDIFYEPIKEKIISTELPNLWNKCTPFFILNKEGLVKDLPKGYPFWNAKIAMSPDSKYVLCGGNAVILWDLTNLYSIKHYVLGKDGGGHTDYVDAVGFSPDSKYAITGSRDTTVRLWNLSDLPNVPHCTVLKGHSGEITSVAMTTNGNCLLSGSKDTTAWLWDLTDLDSITFEEFIGHTKEVTSVAFSHDGKYALTGSEDGSVRVWNLAYLPYIPRCTILEGHKEGVTSLLLSTDGKRILANFKDRMAIVWDIADLTNIKRQQFMTLAATLSPNGKYILTKQGYQATLWDLGNMCNDYPLIGHNDYVTSAAFSSDSRNALTGSVDKRVRIWDLSNLPTIKSYILKGFISTGIESAIFSPDNKFVLVKDVLFGLIVLWDLTYKSKQLKDIIALLKVKQK